MPLLSLSSSVVPYIAPTNLQRFDACVIPMYGHAPFPVILGLPNITGEAGTQSDIGFFTGNRGVVSGSFYQGKQRSNIINGYAGTGSKDIGFSAEGSNSLFNGSQTIQPSSVYSLMIIRA